MPKKVLVTLMALTLLALGLVATRSSTTMLPESSISSIGKTVVGTPSVRETSKSRVLTLSASWGYVPLNPDSVELFWDDGSWDMLAQVQSPTGANDYFAVMFTPPAAPYTILSCRVMGTQNGTPSFAECMVCPGTATVPNIGSPYGVVPNEPTMPMDPNVDWAFVDFSDTTVINTDPLWLVVHWPTGSSNGPYISGDQNSPDNHSYWSLDGTTWTLWSNADWMMRVSIDVIQGVEERVGVPQSPTVHALSQNSPNPFADLTLINYQLPKLTHITLRIHDLSGKLVRTLVDERKMPGCHSVVWEGTDDSGEQVPGGVYFYRLTTGPNTATKKLILLR